jgi:hypothetical protein
MADTVEPAGTTKEEPEYSFSFSYAHLDADKKKHPPRDEAFSFVSRYTRNQSALLPSILKIKSTFTKRIEWMCQYGTNDFWWSTFQIRIPIPGRVYITKSEWIPLPYPFYNANNGGYRDTTIEFKVEIYPEKKSSTDTYRDVIITKYNKGPPSINIEEKKYIFTLVGSVHLWKVTLKTGGKRKTTKRKNRKPIKLKPKSHKKRTPSSWT